MAYRYDPYASSPGSGAGGPSSYPHQGNAPPQHDPYHSSNNGGNYGYGGYTTHAAPGGVYAQPDPSGPASMTAHTGPIRTQYHTYRHQHQPHPATMAYSSPTSPRAATAGGPSSIDSTDRGWGGATTRALSNSVSGTGAGAGGSVGYEEEGGYYEESASASWGGGSYRGDRGRGGAMGRGGRGRGTGGSMSGGYGGGAPPSRREYEDPSRLVRRTDFDSVIDERVSRERPCRTLFIRNVKFGTDVQEIRELFEPIGHIKTLFDMLDKKGMVFLTYYDLRAAMMAKDKLHETRLSGRPIDVHYGLLKDSDLNKPCDLEKNQGSLSLYVVGARGPLDDREIHARFGVFGEVKHVVSSAVGGGTRHGSSLIEFFDSRAMDRAFHEMNGQPMAGGTIELHYEWDLTTVHPGPPTEALTPRPNPPPSRPRSDRSDRDPYPRDGRPPRDHRRSSREFSPPTRRYPGSEGEYPTGAANSHQPYGVGVGGGRGAPVGSAPAAPDQLEKARKMQALLATLTAANNAAASAAGGGSTQGPPLQGTLPPPTGFYLPPPPLPNSSNTPNPNPYTVIPPPTNQPYGNASNPNLPASPPRGGNLPGAPYGNGTSSTGTGSSSNMGGHHSSPPPLPQGQRQGQGQGQGRDPYASSSGGAYSQQSQSQSQSQQPQSASTNNRPQPVPNGTSSSLPPALAALLKNNGHPTNTVTSSNSGQGGKNSLETSGVQSPVQVGTSIQGDLNSLLALLAQGSQQGSYQP